MTELLIQVVIFAVVMYALWYVSGLLQDPWQKVLRVLILTGGFIWLITHIRPIIHAIASCC